MPKSSKKRSTCKQEDEYDSPEPSTPPRHRRSEPAASPREAMPTWGAPPLKLPAFWESSPAAWFVHAESLLALHRVEDDAFRYHHVVAALPSSVAAKLVGLLTNPPATGRYNALKAQLLYSFSLSEAERANELFALNGLGARRPSELMEHMLGLLGTNDPSFLFQHLFLRQLPAPVRAALANTPKADMRTLAAEADKFFLAGHEGAGGTPSPSLAAPARGKKKTRDPAVSPPSSGSKQLGLCYYHERFGQQANRCRPPCTFPAQGNAAAGAPL